MRSLNLATAVMVSTVALAAPTVASAQYTEVLASSTVIGDVEFDWGRDGLICAACNFGRGNTQFNWTDRNNNLYVGVVNPQTGVFESPGTIIDSNAYFWEDWGNGPEWAFSTPANAPGGHPISQLVYTRYEVGEPATPAYTGAALGTLTSTGWKVGFLPGAIGPYNGTGENNMVLPEASQCTTDAVALTVYANVAVPQQMFTEPVSSAAGTAPSPPTPFGPYANGIGERWVPCQAQPQLTFQGNYTYTSPQGVQTVIQEVYWYNLTTGVVAPITTDPTSKARAIMFVAPDIGHHMVLMTAAAGNEIQVYEQSGTQANGVPEFTLINTIVSPETGEPYIFDPKVFVNCSPTCQSYVVYGITAVSGSQTGLDTPNGLAVATLSPSAPTPVNALLASGITGYPYQRLDPKYFITQQGPAVYYDRIVPWTSKTKYKNQGIYFINMQLGAPSGPCVGSGAEGGLQNGC